MSNSAPQLNFKRKDRAMAVASLDEVLDKRIAADQLTCTVIKGDNKNVLPTLAPHFGRFGRYVSPLFPATFVLGGWDRQRKHSQGVS